MKRRTFLKESSKKALGAVALVTGSKLLYAKDNKEISIKVREATVTSVDEEKLSFDQHMSDLGLQHYEFIRVEKPSKEDMYVIEDLSSIETYVIFSSTPLKKGDQISFDYEPISHINRNSIKKFVRTGNVIEEVNINGIEGVITSYQITKKAK